MAAFALFAIVYCVYACRAWWYLEAPKQRLMQAETALTRTRLLVLPQLAIMSCFELFNALIYLAPPGADAYRTLKYFPETAHCLTIPFYCYSLVQLLRFYAERVPTRGQCGECGDNVRPTLPRASSIGFALFLVCAACSLVGEVTSQPTWVRVACAFFN